MPCPDAARWLSASTGACSSRGSITNERRERAHGVFAPASALRAEVVPKVRGGSGPDRSQKTVTARHRAMTWAQRLKRVFRIDIESCRRCGGRLRVIASIEEPPVIERISPTSDMTARRSIALTRVGRHPRTSGRSNRVVRPAGIPDPRWIALARARPVPIPVERFRTEGGDSQRHIESQRAPSPALRAHVPSQTPPSLPSSAIDSTQQGV